mgnify:CR=1 FL=1
MFKTQNEQDYGFSEEEIKEIVNKMREMDYEKFYNKKPKPQKPMSKLEWKFRCFIHRVKRRIENIIFYFIGYEED